MIDELASWYGRRVDAVVTHSFSGDALLLTLADAHPTPAGGRPAAPLFGATNDSSDLALARARATPLILLDPVLADAAGAASGGAVRQSSRHHKCQRDHPWSAPATILHHRGIVSGVTARRCSPRG